MRKLPLIRLLLVLVPAVGLVGWWLGQGGGSTVPSAPAQKPKAASTASQPPAAITSASAEAPPPVFAVPPPLTEAQVQDQSRLIEALRASQDENECRQLGRDLAALNSEEAVAALWQIAEAKASRAMRSAVLDGLDNVTNPKAVSASVNILKTVTEPEMRLAANRLIARGADGDSIHGLTKLYSDDESSVMQQKQVEDAITGIRSQAAINALAALMDNTANPRLAIAAASSLAQIGTPDALGQLQAAQARLQSRGPAAGTVQDAIRQAIAEAAASKGSKSP